jgi:polyferredoxin
MLTFFDNLLRKIKPAWLRWVMFVVFAVISFGSFMSINSYWADTNRLNTVLVITGVIFGILFLAMGAIAYQEQAGDNDNRKQL